jgi:NAD(P)-dependent dehydrogenase (short-subunit alcohol dehydrogenase family)
VGVHGLMRRRTGLPFKTRGSIVNVGSVCSHITMVSNLTPYVMAKHGNIHLSFCLLDY